MKYTILVLTAMAFVSMCRVTLAIEVDITQPPYNADRTGIVDAAPAFRNAIAALKALPYGGQIRVPAGRYLFNSVDPQDLSNPAGVIVDTGGIAIVGDSDARNGAVFPPLEWGSVIFAGPNLNNAPVFLVAKDPGTDDLAGIVFSSIKVTRSVPQSSLGTNADGIAFRSRSSGTLVFVGNVTLNNVRLDGHSTGLRVVYQPSPEEGVDVSPISLQGCSFIRNRLDGARLQLFGELSVSNCLFSYNGNVVNGGDPCASADRGSGMYLQCFKVFRGTAKFSNVTSFGNSGHGLRLEGNSINSPIQDVMISSSQFDYNRWSGIYIRNGRNVSIGGTSITSNGLCTADAGDPAFRRAGMSVEECRSLAIAGVVFQGNRGQGLYWKDVFAGSMSGVSFNSNNASASVFYACQIVGGAGITGSAITFANEFVGGQQQRGLFVGGNSRNIYFTGVAMYDGMTGPFVTANGNPTGNGLIQWMSPGTSAETTTVVGP